MTKKIALLAMFVLMTTLVVGCGTDKEETDLDTTTEVTVDVEGTDEEVVVDEVDMDIDAEITVEPLDESTDSEDMDVDAMTFEDADVQAFVDSYEEYMNDYKDAIESKDMQAFSDLSTQGQDLAVQAQAAAGKLEGSDLEKFNAYITKKTEEATELAMQFGQ